MPWAAGPRGTERAAEDGVMEETAHGATESSSPTVSQLGVQEFVEHQKMEARMDSRVRASARGLDELVIDPLGWTLYARGLDELVVNIEDPSLLDPYIEDPSLLDPYSGIPQVESRVGIWGEFSQTLDKVEPVTGRKSQKMLRKAALKMSMLRAAEARALAMHQEADPNPNTPAPNPVQQ